MSFMSAKLESGIKLVLETLNFEKYIDDCDIVITGEGRLDYQSAFRKVPVGVSGIAKQYSKPVVAFCGAVGDGAQICNEYGIDAYFPVIRKITTLQQAMLYENAYSNLRDSVHQVFNLLNTVGFAK
jgi:glycerate kinase